MSLAEIKSEFNAAAKEKQRLFLLKLIERQMTFWRIYQPEDEYLPKALETAFENLGAEKNLEEITYALEVAHEVAGDACYIHTEGYEGMRASNVAGALWFVLVDMHFELTGEIHNSHAPESDEPNLIYALYSLAYTRASDDEMMHLYVPFADFEGETRNEELLREVWNEAADLRAQYLQSGS